MRRAAAFVLGTITGTSLLVAAKLGNATAGEDATITGDATGTGAVVVGGGPAGPPTTRGTSGPTATVRPTGRPTGPATTRGAGGPTATGRPTGAPTTTKPGGPPTHTPTPTPPPTHSGYTDGTYTASAPVRNGSYGTLAMTVTISGGKITAVSAHETGPTESNCYHSACPTLTSEALSAQSANISSVSRATYSSSAYKAALKAVLARA